MTSLFIEYETSRKSKEDITKLIGKRFYWSKTTLGEPIPYRFTNEFEITSIEYHRKTPYLLYRYNDGLKSCEMCETILKLASPVDVSQTVPNT